MSTLSVVLPCYNEEQNIAATVQDVWSWMQSKNIEGTIIAVDDGSKDATLAVLKDLQHGIEKLTVVQHEKNAGYGVAVRSGCDSATTDLIAFMDSDGQFHAKDLSILLEHINQYPFVTGRRIKRADPLIRNLFGKMLAVMNGLVLGLWTRDVNCGMKLFRRDIWPLIRPTYGVEKLFNTEMYMKLKKQNISWLKVPVPHYPRTAGKQTGGSVRVIFRMFKELLDLRRSMKKHRVVDAVSAFAQAQERA